MRVPKTPLPLRWLNVADAAAYLGFPSAESFYKFAKRNSIPYAHCGRTLRFLTTDLEKVLEKHGAQQQSARGAL